MALFLLLLVFIQSAPAPTIKSTFECNNKDSTMSFYSYLKEPSLEESGFTRGYKSGSMNYFVDGDTRFKERITYYDGQIDAAHRNDPGVDHNSTLVHTINLSFQGEKGISEFYAKGFFPSNRAVSAWKKIRYENVSNYMLGPSYDSQDIFVDAVAGMGPVNATGLSGDYDFRYSAKVGNGVLEIKDATGWTNKSGARRIDWEQEGLIRGKEINARNDLIVENLFFPGGGWGNDWLPCCFIGTQPAIEPKGQDWPTGSTYAVLMPYMLLPTQMLNRTCNGSNCTTGKIPFSCSPGNCTSFECIYTSDIDSLPYGGGMPFTPHVGTPNLTIVKEITEINDSNAAFRIKIENSGGTMLNGIKLVDILPTGLHYINSKLKYKEKEVPLQLEDNASQNLTWKLIDLGTSESEYMYLNTKIVGDPGDVYRNAAYATYIFKNETRYSNVARPALRQLSERE
jgi:uncharacterized repeat protein (TIGR01451 family)